MPQQSRIVQKNLVEVEWVHFGIAWSDGRFEVVSHNRDGSAREVCRYSWDVGAAPGPLEHEVHVVITYDRDVWFGGNGDATEHVAERAAIMCGRPDLMEPRRRGADGWYSCPVCRKRYRTRLPFRDHLCLDHDWPHVEIEGPAGFPKHLKAQENGGTHA